MNNFTYLKDKNFTNGRHYIGASNMPTLFGLTKPYGQTTLTLWEELTGKRESFKGNKLTAMGHWQEDGILARYVKDYTDADYKEFWASRLLDETEYNGLYSFTEARREDYPFCVAHGDLLDLRDTENPILIQAKNTGFFAASRKEDKNKGYDKEDHSQNGIPLSVYLQEQWEMYCYGVEITYVAVLIGGNDWQLYGPVKYDKKIVEKELALAKRLWEHVENNTPPKPETWPDICSLFPEYKEGEATTIGGQEYEDVLTMREELKKINWETKKLESKKEDIINATGLLIGGNEILRGTDGAELAKVSLRPGKECLSLKDLKEYNASLYTELKEKGIIKTSDPWRGLTFKGTNVSAYNKCKQCGEPVGGNGTIKKEGRRILFGPFCKSCYDRIKGEKG